MSSKQIINEHVQQNYSKPVINCVLTQSLTKERKQNDLAKIMGDEGKLYQRNRMTAEFFNESFIEQSQFDSNKTIIGRMIC